MARKKRDQPMNPVRRCQGRARVVALSALMMLAGCGGRIWQDEATPESVRLHWYTEEASLGDAQAKAEEHCRHVGGHARLSGEFADRDVTSASFLCHAPAAPVPTY